MMNVKPMSEHNGPGWSIELDDGERMYQLWAPRADRPQWSAHWSRRHGHTGQHKRGKTMVEVLGMFPADREAIEAAGALSAAAKQAQLKPLVDILDDYDAIEAELTEHHDRAIIVRLSETDDLGRTRFCTHWWGYRNDLERDGHRAQLFHANLTVHTEQWQAAGKTVVLRPLAVETP